MSMWDFKRYILGLQYFQPVLKRGYMLGRYAVVNQDTFSRVNDFLALENIFIFLLIVLIADEDSIFVNNV